MPTDSLDDDKAVIKTVSASHRETPIAARIAIATSLGRNASSTCKTGSSPDTWPRHAQLSNRIEALQRFAEV